MAFCQTKRCIIYRIIDTQLSPVVFISLKYRVHIYVCQAFVEPEKYEKSDTRYWSSFARSDAHFPEDWVNIKIRLPIECIRVGERNQYLSTVYSIYHFIDESHHQSGLAFVTVHDYSFGEQRKLREGEKFISWLSTIRSTDLLNRLQYIHFQRGNVLAQFALLLQRVVNGLCSLFSHFHSNKHIFSFFFQSC